MSKQAGYDELRSILEEKRKGKSIVSINGSFDLLHVGHIRLLTEAKAQGDILVVGLNTDRSVQAWKRKQGNPDWQNRPINGEQQRAEILSALEVVDHIIFFDELEPHEFLRAVKPDIHVNGADYGSECVEGQTLKEIGAKLHIAKFHEGHSTSKLVSTMRKQ